MEVEEEGAEMEAEGSSSSEAERSRTSGGAAESRDRRAKGDKGSERQKAEAMRRRQKLMAKMCAMQKSFVKENEALLKEAIVGEEGEEGRAGCGRAMELESGSESASGLDTDSDNSQLFRPVAIGSQRVLGPFFNTEREQFRCILCQVGHVGMPAFVASFGRRTRVSLHLSPVGGLRRDNGQAVHCGHRTDDSLDCAAKGPQPDPTGAVGPKGAKCGPQELPHARPGSLRVGLAAAWRLLLFVWAPHALGLLEQVFRGAPTQTATSHVSAIFSSPKALFLFSRVLLARI